MAPSLNRSRWASATLALNWSRRASATLPLEALGREVAAIAQQGWLIARHRHRPVPVVAGERVAVFVHGFMAAGPVFDPMRAKVTAATGLATLDFSYGVREDFDAIASRFARFVDTRVPASAPIALVGHSLGGLVARWYIEELGGRARVDRLVTLATPHAGTETARYAPGPLRDVLMPGSAVIERLRRAGAGLAPVPHTAIVAEADRTIVPLESASAAPSACVHRVPGVGHNGALFSPRVHALIIDALR
jgi:pimeloyl-ACP methyl ester carboxylesterase